MGIAEEYPVGAVLVDIGGIFGFGSLEVLFRRHQVLRPGWTGCENKSDAGH